MGSPPVGQGGVGRKSVWPLKHPGREELSVISPAAILPLLAAVGSCCGCRPLHPPLSPAPPPAPPPAVRKRNKGGGITFGRKRRRAVRKDREPDEDDAAFALTRFVPMLQEVLEDAGGRGGAGWGTCGPAHGCCAVLRPGPKLLPPGPRFAPPGARRQPQRTRPPPCPPPAAAGRLSTDEYPYVATPASPSGSRTSLPSSADTTPKAGVGVSVRSVRTTGAWAKKGGTGGTPDKADAGRVSGSWAAGGAGRQTGRPSRSCRWRQQIACLGCHSSWC